jgi:hypothetical protein
MTWGYEKKKLLILVKTYPNPSKGYVETVCTAGVTETGDWIRLYPVSYRYLENDQQYPKYSWVEVEVQKASGDNRKESYKPKNESITVVRPPLGGKLQWDEAKSILVPTAHKSLCELVRLKEQNVSLGIFKPLKITGFYWKEETPEWTEEEQEAIIQQDLFGIGKKPLEKMPYSFHYQFECNDERCNGHDLTIIDWEIQQAYRNWRTKYNENEVLQKIKEKWLDTLFGPDRDTYFIVGTHHRFKTFIILGVFWPPKDLQTSLFSS